MRESSLQCCEDKSQAIVRAIVRVIVRAIVFTAYLRKLAEGKKLREEIREMVGGGGGIQS
jgi:hypothetical protein